jgi:hypothetical protein
MSIDPWASAPRATRAASTSMAFGASPSLRDTGVAFVPLRGETADVVVAWIDDRPRPGVQALRDLIQTLAHSTDLLAAG